MLKKPNFKDAIDVVCYVALWFVVAMGIGAVAMVLMMVLE